MERVGRGIYDAGGWCARFKDCSLEGRWLVCLMEEVMADLTFLAFVCRVEKETNRVSTCTASHNRHVIWISSKRSNIFLDPSKQQCLVFQSDI